MGNIKLKKGKIKARSFCMLRKDKKNKRMLCFQAGKNNEKTKHIAIQFFRSRWKLTICLFVHFFTLFRCNYEYNRIVQITVDKCIHIHRV